MNQPPNGVLLGIQCPRRSDRKETTFPIWLRNEEMGPIWEEETETQIVSRCGAGLRCRHLVSADTVVVVVRRDTGRRAKARVRYSRFNPEGKRELGIEFIDNDNFWGLDWNSSEPINFQPEQVRTPSGLAQMRDAFFPPAIVEVEVTQNKFDNSSPSTAEHPRSKRVERQLLEDEGFVFTEDGKPFGSPVRTLNEFVSSLPAFPLAVVEGHLHRDDFSQWVAGVFQDQFLTFEIRKLEQRYRPGNAQNLREALARLIENYCAFSDETEATPSNRHGVPQTIAGVKPDHLHSR